MIIWFDGYKAYELEKVSNFQLLNIISKIERGIGYRRFTTRRNRNIIYDELHDRAVISYFTYIKCRIFGGKLYDKRVKNKKNCK